MPPLPLTTLQAVAAVAPDPLGNPRHTIRRIVLTGFMGAGKSTVGRLLAHQLGWSFLDLDEHIEQRAGISVPSIFSSHGEPHFRRLESSALANALRQSSLVLALGGGAPETLTNRLLLEQTPHTTVVFLDAPFPVLFDRCMLQALIVGTTDRPNLNDPGAASARFTARRPFYLRLARVTIPTETLTPPETVARITDLLTSTVD